MFKEQRLRGGEALLVSITEIAGKMNISSVGYFCRAAGNKLRYLRLNACCGTLEGQRQPMNIFTTSGS